MKQSFAMHKFDGFRTLAVALSTVCAISVATTAMAQSPEPPSEWPKSEQRIVIGIAMGAVTPETASRLGLAPGQGASVVSVSAGSAAAAAGIATGDVILSIDGVAVNHTTLTPAIAARQSGETIKVGLQRGKRQRTVKAVLQSVRLILFAPCRSNGAAPATSPTVFDHSAETKYLSVQTPETGPNRALLRGIYQYRRAADKLQMALNFNGTDYPFSDMIFGQVQFHANGAIGCSGEIRQIRYINRDLALVTAQYNAMSGYSVQLSAADSPQAEQQIMQGRPPTAIGQDAERLFKLVAANPAYFLGPAIDEAMPAAAPRPANPVPAFMRPAPMTRGIGLEKAVVTASTAPPPPSAAPRAVGTTFRDCPDCPDMVVLPRGSFAMGSPSSEDGRANDEGPMRQVTIARPFAMGRYEVTYDEWNVCVADGACRKVWEPESGGGKRPATMVTWFDARAYADWLSQRTGQLYTIPSEAEWEYAARAATSTPWNTGDALLTDDANIMDQFKQTVPVGGFPPNAFGLYDMHGNVYEWVLDCIDVGYFGVPGDGGANVKPMCANRGLRGGGWKSEPNGARSAGRDRAPATHSSLQLGFRVARAL